MPYAGPWPVEATDNQAVWPGAGVGLHGELGARGSTRVRVIRPELRSRDMEAMWEQTA